MKKLNITTNGHPRSNHDILHLQDAVLEIGNALGGLCADTSNNPVMISGFAVTQLGGGLFTYGTGWVYMNNEIFYFGGTTSNTVAPDYLRISSTYAANNPYLGKNIHNIRVLIPIYGTPSAGDVAFGSVVNNKAVDNIAKKRFGEWKQMNPAGSSSYPRFNVGYASIGSNPVMYRINGDGTCEFKGEVDLTGVVGASPIWFNLFLFATPFTLGATYTQHGSIYAILSGSYSLQAWNYSAQLGAFQIWLPAPYTIQTSDRLYMNSVKYYCNP